MTSGDGDKRYAREEHETGFTPILRQHVEATPGALGAALVDGEGEAVDYAGDTIDPFDLKIAAAHFRIVLSDIEKGKLAGEGGPTSRLLVLTDKRTFVLTALPEGYALLSILRANAALGHADRSLDGTLRALHREAGWAYPPGAFRWHPIDVEIDARARPHRIRVRHQWTAVEPIGRVVVGLQPGEVGWRVDVAAAGCETTLVLGRDDKWYADLPFEGDERDRPLEGADRVLDGTDPLL
ncbi:MAG: hypothetical protein HYV09_35680 [Deltaproteobacteria bacterium]|nr:hypothetical protein [Deltaproteobacteria bacterium]